MVIFLYTLDCIISKVNYHMGSNCCRQKDFTFAVAQIPQDYFQEEVQPLPIDELVTALAATYSLKPLSSLQQSQTGELIYHQEESTKAIFSMRSNILTGNVTLLNHIKQTGNQMIWKVLRKDETEALSEGDRLKIGVQQFKVYELFKDFFGHEMLSYQIEQHEQHCRYCFKNTFSECDPLVSLCKCAGSVKYIHLSCLRAWMNSKVYKSQNNPSLQWYKYEMPRCQICKTLWPRSFNFKNKPYQLYSFRAQIEHSDQCLSNRTPYIVLQTGGIDQNGQQAILFVKIGLEQRCTVGSSFEECRLELDFSGISAKHATIYHCNNNIFVSDLGSKSGTLVCAKRIQNFSPLKGILLLYKNILIRIATKRSWAQCTSWNAQCSLQIAREDEKQE